MGHACVQALVLEVSNALLSHRGPGIHKHRQPPTGGGCQSQTLAQVNAVCGLPARLTGLTPRFARLGFIDCKGTARELCALDPSNGSLGRLAVGHLDEPKAFGTARVAVRNDTDLVHNTILLKELADVLIGSGKRQITYKDIHVELPQGDGTNNRQVIRTVCRHNTEEKRRSM